MSLALEKLKPVCVHDPRVVQQDRVYPVLKGGSDVLYKQFTTTSVSQSSISFSCPPPSQKVYVDRRVHLVLPVRLTLTATGLDPGQLLLNPGQCCLRSYPAQKALDTIQMTLNNQSMSINMSDTLSALEHFNIDRKLKAVDYSKCPTYGACQSQQFSDLFGSTRSPMALYADVPDGVAPSAFPFTIVSQTNDNAGAGASTATSVIDFVTTEPLFLSPLYWGGFDCDESAFMGLRTFDMTLNFLNNGANRMIAIDKDSAGVTLNPSTWNAQMQFGNFSGGFSYRDNQPLLLFQYLTPQLTDKAIAMDQVLNYPYFNVERYLTDVPAIAPGATQVASSNNIQLNSIPSKMYIFLRKRNNDLQKDPFSTDTFLKMNSVSIQWGNRNGVLASANSRQLYDLAVKNGCMLSYQAWSGLKLNKQALASAGFGTAAEQYAGTGSILALDPIDLGLDALDAPGKLAQLMLQVQVDYENVSTEAISPTLYVVIISQGLFTIYNGQASSLVGVLNSQDILECHKQTAQEMITYADVRRLNGGNFLTNIKNKLISAFRKAKPYIKKGLDFAREYGPAIAETAAMLGLGEEQKGGVRARGGRPVSRKTLKNRMRKM